MTDPVNHFASLYAVNVSEHIERKGNFSFLSWPYAVAQLRLADPAASWEVRRFDGLPYLLCDLGVFVEVAVTVQGVTLSQIHPVLDGRNRPLTAPTSFDINTSIQRCLVKAIALHGLGLYIYAGEDMPNPARDAANDPGVSDAMATNSGRPADTTRINGVQQTQIYSLVMETGTNLEKLLSHFGINHLRDLPVAEFSRVMRTLEQRRSA